MNNSTWAGLPVLSVSLIAALFLQRAEPSGNRVADLVRGIFLDKVRAFDAHLALIWPLAAELALRANQNRARFRVDEELGQCALLEPIGIRADYLRHFGGLAVDWNLAR